MGRNVQRPFWGNRCIQKAGSRQVRKVVWSEASSKAGLNCVLCLLRRTSVVQIMKTASFWDITPSSPLKSSWRFGRTYHLHLQCQRTTIFKSVVNRNWIFFISISLTTICFGPYGPSSGGIYTTHFPGAILTTRDPLFWLFSSLSMYVLQTLFYYFFYIFFIMLKLWIKLKLRLNR
jgi:hypothetical protein